MLSEQNSVFTKENLDFYLKELAKEFRKLNGKTMPAEIILVGGASVLVNYGFRDMTTDVDAMICATSAMKEAINRVRDKYELPNGWLNTDFMRTGSYSTALSLYATYYRTFSNIVTVRTISGEYLIAMKLRSGRMYKNDISDIVGILAEHERKGVPITIQKIDNAVKDLYGDWSDFPAESREFAERIISEGNYEMRYSAARAEEKNAKEILKTFEQDYPKVLNASNLNSILKILKSKKSQ